MKALSRRLFLAAALAGLCGAQNAAVDRVALPRLVVQTGHSRAIEHVSFSPDGRQILTQNEYGLVLWDVASGRQIRQDSAGMEKLRSSVIGTAGKIPAIETLGFRNGRLQIARRELKSWKPILIEFSALTGPQDPQAIRRMVFAEELLTISGDGSLVYSRSALGERVLRDVEPGGRFVKWKEPEQSIHERMEQSSHALLATDAAGRLALVSASAAARQPESAQLWDLAAGTRLRQIGDPARIVTALALSPDGRFGLTVSSPRLQTPQDMPDVEPHLWDAASGKELLRLRGHAAKATIQRLPSTLASRSASYIWSVAFSPDNSLAVTGGADGTARIWSVATGQELQRLNVSWGVLSAVFSPDGSATLTGSVDGIARLWDTKSGKLLREFRGGARDNAFAVVSPDGKRLASAGDLSYTFEDELTGHSAPETVWDLQSGRVWQWDIGQVLSASFSADGNRLAMGMKDGSAVVRDMTTGDTIARLTFAKPVHEVALSPDGKVLAAQEFGTGFRLWDIQAGRDLERREETGNGNGGLSISTDGQLAMGAYGGLLQVRKPGSAPRIFETSTSQKRAIAFAPDNRTLLLGQAQYSFAPGAALWSIEKGMQVRRFNMPQFTVAALSHDGRVAITGNQAGAIRMWDVASGRALRSFDTAGPEAVSSLAFLSGDRRIAAGHKDGSIALLDAAGALQCTLFAFNNGDWAVVAPDGRFDTNDLRGNLPVHWIVPDDPLRPLPLELFLREYYEPKLLSRILSGETLPKIRDIRELNRLQPLVAIQSVVPEPGGERVSVEVEVEQAVAGPLASGASLLQLFRDNRLVGTALEGPAAMRSAADRKRTVRFDGIRLPHDGAARYQFSAYAFNTDRVKSQTAVRAYTPARPSESHRGRAYLIQVGVNQAGDPRLELKFAANDARVMAARLQTGLQQSGAFERVAGIQLISDFATPDGASKAAIQAVFDKLAGKPVDSRRFPVTVPLERVGPDDMVLFSFSGHGYADRTGQFFLIPSDAGLAGPRQSLDAILHRSVSSLDLSNWLRDVDARELVLIVDACQSAASVESDGFKPGPMGSRGLGQLAWDKGARILTATQADNVAIESGRIGQGLLTFALTRDALDFGLADRQPKDGHISLSEWLTFGVDRVPALLEEIRRGGYREAGGQGDRLLVIEKPGQAISGAAQQPALFDFSRSEGPIMSAGPGTPVH